MPAPSGVNANLFALLDDSEDDNEPKVTRTAGPSLLEGPTPMTDCW